MGAYENPALIVDTQSAQHIQNLQQTVANVASDYANTTYKAYLENKKKLEENQFKVDSSTLQMYGKLDENAKLNQSINWHKTYDPFVQEYADLNSKLLNGTAKSRPEILQRMSKIKHAIDISADTITSIMSNRQDFEKASKNIGNQGGLSSVGNNPEQQAAMLVLNAKAPGKAYFVVDADDPASQQLHVEGEFGKYQFDSTNTNKAAKGLGLFNINPDQTAAIDGLKIKSGVFNSHTDKNNNPTGVPDRITDVYVDKSSEIKIKSSTQETGETVYNKYHKINVNKIRQDYATDAYLQADGLLANPASAAGFYVDIMKGDQSCNITPETLLSDKTAQEDFRREYLNYIVKSTTAGLKQDDKGNYLQPILKEDNTYATETIIEQKPDKTRSGKTPQLTPNQQQKLKEKSAKAFAEGLKLNDLTNTDPIESADGKKRVSYLDGEWWVENLASGAWKLDTAVKPVKDKVTAAGKIGIKKSKPNP